MHNLDSQSLHLLLSVLEDLHSDADPATLPERAVRSAMKLIGCDLLTFDFFSGNPRYEDTAWSNDPELLNPEFMSTFGRLVHQHPTVRFLFEKPDGEAMRLTDAVSQEAFERTDIYNELFRPVYVNKQMGCALLSEGDLTMTYAFSRKDVDFSDREKAIATLAAPHFVNAIRNGFAFGRVSAAMEAGGSGVIALNAAGNITFSSQFARLLVEKYFAGERLAPNRLPETLAGWFRQAHKDSWLSEYKLPPTPFSIKQPGSSLTIRLLDNRSSREEILLFEERKLPTPLSFISLGLTPRESEILYWIAEGKSDADIAALCSISIRTVQKHVENLYTKLGVETRTAAILRCFEEGF